MYYLSINCDVIMHTNIHIYVGIGKTLREIVKNIILFYSLL